MLRYMTSGESHGKGLFAVMDGVPAGLKIDTDFINRELLKRMHGYGRGGRMSIEKDTVQVVAGCRGNMTIGSPVGLFIANRDHKIDKMPEVFSPRPGHADLAGIMKYGLKGAREVLERASARETAARVAAGAVAKLLLREFGMDVLSHVKSIGSEAADTSGLTIDEIAALTDIKNSRLRCADKKAEELMCREIDNARKAGDTLGGVFEVIVRGVPPGLGSYSQWDKRLDGALARAVMSIPAVKAVSIGGGIDCAKLPGSEVHDPISYDNSGKTFKRGSNNAGGVEGGVSNGEAVILEGYMKPIATLMKPLKTVDINTKTETEAATERADVTAVPSCGVVAEAVTAIEIASAFLDKFGGDSINEIQRHFEGYKEYLGRV